MNIFIKVITFIQIISAIALGLLGCSIFAVIGAYIGSSIAHMNPIYPSFPWLYNYDVLGWFGALVGVGTAITVYQDKSKISNSKNEPAAAVSTMPKVADPPLDVDRANMPEVPGAFDRQAFRERSDRSRRSKPRRRQE